MGDGRSPDNLRRNDVHIVYKHRGSGTMCNSMTIGSPHDPINQEARAYRPGFFTSL